jgi:hypothetical protein
MSAREPIDLLLRQPVRRVPIIQLTPTWTKHILTDPRPDLLFGNELVPEAFEFDVPNSCIAVLRISTLREEDGVFGDVEMVPFLIRPGQPELHADGSVKIFGSRKIGPGTWVVTPSLNVPEMIHAFLVLCGVPEPAPWEQSA